jgi:hypothetical protein
MGTATIIAGLIGSGALVCAIRGGQLARRRRRRFAEGFTLGFILGPLGIFLASQLSSRTHSFLTAQDRFLFQKVASFHDCNTRYLQRV